MDNIKACPHCGGAACLNANYSYKARAYFVFVKCNICGATGKTYRDDKDPGADCNDWRTASCNDAVEAWNMRTTDKIDDQQAGGKL